MSVCGLRMLCIPAVVAAALTVGSGIAVADDDGYLAQLKKIGVAWQPGGDTTLIQLGRDLLGPRRGQNPGRAGRRCAFRPEQFLQLRRRHRHRQRRGIQLLPLIRHGRAG